MKPPRVKAYNGSATSKFVVDPIRINGRRSRKFFAKRVEAESFLRQYLIRLKNEGQSTHRLTDVQRAEAFECAALLKPYGKTLTDAVKHLVAHLAAVQKSCNVSTLVTEFKAAKKQDGASDSYLRDIKNRLSQFEDEFGTRTVAEITASELDDWLRGLDVKAQTRNNFRTVLRTLFEYATVRGYTAENPAIKTAKAKVVRAAPKIFTPEQMRLVLEKAPRDFIPYLVIGAFAGLRAVEIERLDWKEVDLGAKLIHVAAEKSKTAQRRLVTVSDNLAAWLAPHVKESGPVAPLMRRKIVARGQTAKAAGIKWPANGCRHSFASYHLAHFKNAASTSAELGHTSSTVLFKHYRELVRPEAAAAWMQIAPPADYSNVVAFDRKQA